MNPVDPVRAWESPEHTFPFHRGKTATKKTTPGLAETALCDKGNCKRKEKQAKDPEGSVQTKRR